MIRTIGELREVLKRLPDEMEYVIISKPGNETMLISGVDFWEEGVTIFCRTPGVEFIKLGFTVGGLDEDHKD